LVDGVEVTLGGIGVPLTLIEGSQQRFYRSSLSPP
jgi:hypothetical protein